MSTSHWESFPLDPKIKEKIAFISVLQTAGKYLVSLFFIKKSSYFKIVITTVILNTLKVPLCLVCLVKIPHLLHRGEKLAEIECKFLTRTNEGLVN